MAIKIFHAAFECPHSLSVGQREIHHRAQECSGASTCTAGYHLEKNCDACVQLVM